jgi:hypothetical protein
MGRHLRRKKKIGGLGIRNLQAINQGLILSSGLEVSKGTPELSCSHSKKNLQIKKKPTL